VYLVTADVAFDRDWALKQRGAARRIGERRGSGKRIAAGVGGVINVERGVSP